MPTKVVECLVFLTREWKWLLSSGLVDSFLMWISWSRTVEEKRGAVHWLCRHHMHDIGRGLAN